MVLRDLLRPYLLRRSGRKDRGGHVGREAELVMWSQIHDPLLCGAWQAA